MKTKLFQAAAATACAAVAVGAVLPSAAAAQSRTYSSGQAYDQTGQYYYDGCQRSETNRAVVGGLIGAGIGAAIGNNTGSPRRNDENALIGGLLGAVAGAAIGGSTAACTSSAPRTTYNTQPTYNYSYTQPNYGYTYTQPNYGYTQPNYNYNYDYSYGYGQTYDPRYDPRYRQPAQPRCTYVENNIRMPDGRTQKQMVQVCQDASGRYQVVQ